MPSEYTAKILRRVVHCQVPGCATDLEKAFYKRYKVCPAHATEAKVTLNGVAVRFCKGHGRFEPLDRFDGDRKGCRQMLDGVNRRRKRKKQVDEGDETTEEEEGGDASSGGSEGAAAAAAARKSQRRRWRARRAGSSSDSDTPRSTASKESMQTAAGPGGLALPAGLLSSGSGRSQLSSALTVEDIIGLHSDPLLPSFSFSGAPTVDLADILVDFPVPPLPHQVLSQHQQMLQAQQHQQHRQDQHQGLLAAAPPAALAGPLPLPMHVPLPAPALEMLFPAPALEMLLQMHTAHQARTAGPNQLSWPR